MRFIQKRTVSGSGCGVFVAGYELAAVSNSVSKSIRYIGMPASGYLVDKCLGSLCSVAEKSCELVSVRSGLRVEKVRCPAMWLSSPREMSM